MSLPEWSFQTLVCWHSAIHLFFPSTRSQIFYGLSQNCYEHQSFTVLAKPFPAWLHVFDSLYLYTLFYLKYRLSSSKHWGKISTKAKCSRVVFNLLITTRLFSKGLCFFLWHSARIGRDKVPKVTQTEEYMDADFFLLFSMMLPHIWRRKVITQIE